MQIAADTRAARSLARRRCIQSLLDFRAEVKHVINAAHRASVLEYVIPDVIATQPDGGNLLSCAAQLTIDHVAADCLFRPFEQARIGNLDIGNGWSHRSRGRHFEESSPLHVGTSRFPVAERAGWI